MDMTCGTCGKKGRVRKQRLDFYLVCEGCGVEGVVHRNVGLETL
jgi:hypothetical protein